MPTAATAGTTVSQAEPAQHPAAHKDASSPDHSIQQYGSEAAGERRTEVLGAMRSQLTAMGSGDFADVCSGLRSSVRRQLHGFLKSNHQTVGCVRVLKTLVSPAVATEARKAAQAPVKKVRIGQGDAFVLFTPPGGVPSYFVMKEEAGEWKATSLAPGTPLNATAAP